MEAKFDSTNNEQRAAYRTCDSQKNDGKGDLIADCLIFDMNAQSDGGGWYKVQKVDSLSGVLLNGKKNGKCGNQNCSAPDSHSADNSRGKARQNG